MCTKEIEFKCILFALCYFHAVVAERRKFGAQGWNRSYPFNNGDLTISINVLFNYLEANVRVRMCRLMCCVAKQLLNSNPYPLAMVNCYSSALVCSQKTRASQGHGAEGQGVE